MNSQAGAVNWQQEYYNSTTNPFDEELYIRGKILKYLLYSSRQAFWCIESGGTEVFS